ncbi:unnamed protein product [Oikopleura dioica]|uniref:Uncharacterized protein n=1 Tax=Oikopleura dioica TaxID=34765 RepID=E4Y254_OIKDI|nr:unnamed protein product [Oikopleura dioica]
MAAPRPATNKIIQFKLVLFGEAAVGKSSLVLRFVKGEFKVFILTSRIENMWLQQSHEVSEAVGMNALTIEANQKNDSIRY